MAPNGRWNVKELFFEYESIIRLGSFLGIFALLAIWEIVSPKRQLTHLRPFRWLSNFGLIVVSSILVRFVFPTAAVGIAILVEKNHWGFLYYFELPFTLHFIAAFMLMDLSIYFQHVMFHSLPMFWRFHRVHHSDLDCDITTGLRFHPFEILLSMLIKFLTIAAFGIPVLAVVIFEIILNAASMFTHSNIRIPEKIEPVLRLFIVTPDMHRIHHSINENETNSNFGFFISLWDRIFGTYIGQPEAGHTNMQIGLDEFREPKWQDLRWLIYLPFVSKIKGYAINKRKIKRAE
jgi:sterol desaturase/sphingolipid hydroxylase (fatty acid hydroxylase superfamily)